MRINEENFITYLKARNQNALNYVIDNYSGLIKAITRKHLSSLDYMQEECIDDILLSIWYGIDNYDSSRSSFKNWVAGIARFKAIDYQRKYYKGINEQPLENIEIFSESSLEDEVLRDVINENLEKILNQLKPDEKQLFLDYYLKGRNVQEIAVEKDIKVTTVYNKLSRTREKLRNNYKERLEGSR